jgi:hypothetical protein
MREEPGATPVLTHSFTKLTASIPYRSATNPCDIMVHTEYFLARAWTREVSVSLFEDVLLRLLGMTKSYNLLHLLLGQC